MSTTFEIEHSYADALVRGYRGALLSPGDYANLSQCETVDDMKVHIMNTEYASIFQDLPSPLTPQSIAEACTQKMVSEFRALRDAAVEPLATFLDYITYGYMIDNIVLILSETLHERQASDNAPGEMQALLDKCHPLGLFEGITALCVAQTPAELYHLVLVNCPLAKYFLTCLSMENLDEMHVEVIRNLLYKEYLKDFFNYCTKTLDSETGEVMSEILKFEADRRAINITVNSWNMRNLSKDDRQRLYPTFGELWPEGTNRLMEAGDMEGVRAAVDYVETYRDILTQHAENPEKSLEDCFFEREVELNKLAFERMYQYGAFYSYFRLKEQEIRNIIWIAECIAQGKRDKVMNFTQI